MADDTRERESALETRSRALFEDSVEGIDMPTRSRLNQARQAALEAATQRRPWFLRLPMWTPAAGVAAAAVLGVALWAGSPSGTLPLRHGVTADSPANLEDLDLVASSDPASGDAIEMLQDDIDFYDFADTAASTGPSA